MTLKRKLSALMLATAPLIGFSCSKTNVQSRNRVDENSFPQTVLWAWERPEELEFLDPRQFAVAFLAQTLVLKDDEVVFQPRHQPLKVRPEIKLMAVTRIESRKITGAPSALSPA